MKKRIAACLAVLMLTGFTSPAFAETVDVSVDVATAAVQEAAPEATATETDAVTQENEQPAEISAPTETETAPEDAVTAQPQADEITVDEAADTADAQETPADAEVTETEEYGESEDSASDQDDTEENSYEPEDQAEPDEEDTDSDSASAASDDTAAADSDDDELLEDEEEYEAYAPVKINATTFPDPNFRAAVYENLDKDKNYILDSDEILKARNIWCDNRGIKSLKGIEYLVELRGLYCMKNEIETMDLSKNKLLTGVWCSFNKFTRLDFTPNPDLEWVYCHYNNLTYLNVSNNPKISYIECNTNPLKQINVSNNPLLEHLMCGDCELTTLDVSRNPNLQHLDCFRNKFTKLDLSKNTKMKRLDVWDNPNLKYVDISGMPGLQTYNCGNIGATKVDVTHNPELYKLICNYNRELRSVDVSHNPKLAILKAEDCNLQSIDLSKNPKMRLLYIAINKDIKTLNIGNCPYLIKTYTEGESKPNWYGHIWMIDYGGDDSTGGDNIYCIWANDGVKINTNGGTALVAQEYYSDLDSGKPDSYYIKREYVIQTLYEMAGSPRVSGTTRFKDVKSGSSYEKAVIWGEKNAICMGYPDFSSNVFGVGKWITRQDLMFMLMRYSECMGLERAIDFGRSDDYLDYFDIDFDHWEAVTWCATWHIMEGKGEPGSDKDEQYFDPYGRVSLSDFEISLNNLMEKNGRSANISLGASVPKPTVKVSSVFGGKMINFYCDDGFADIYYNFGSSNITTSCKSIKPGSYVFLDEPASGANAAIYFKAYRNGKWSELGKWGVLNVQIDKPIIVRSGAKSANTFRIYTQTKDSYIVYTLDGTYPTIYEGTNRPTVKNGKLVWSTSTVITVPKGKTVRAVAIRCGLATSDVAAYKNNG